ncbi:MAG: hypothetical protein CBARDCOR_2331 [uncultured Caballeronia sp.]|nr:MAG: hypothetical protein CBARDCOR_2331 [uncultured Caballeronia sp.]
MAKRVHVRIREKEGFNRQSFWRAPYFSGAKYWNCTLWTLTSSRFESVFFASFLCR